MQRLTIRQFRALLAGRGDANPTVRVYRDLARRPDVATRMVHGEWAMWTATTQAAQAAQA